MKSLGLDPKHYKYLKSDDKSTTLQHKHGHTVTIAHNAVAPKMRTMLQALSKLPQQDETQVQKEESDAPYGKVIMKEAEGGEIRWDQYTAPQADAASSPTFASSVQDKTTPQQDKMRQAQQAASDSIHNQVFGSRTPVSNEDEGYTTYAKGGEINPKLEQSKKVPPPRSGINMIAGNSPFAEGGDVSASGYKKGESTQGEMVRHKDNKQHIRDEAKGRAEMERTVKPNMKHLHSGGTCYACGGPVKMARGGDPANPAKGLDFNPAQEEAMHAYDAGLPCLNPHCKSYGHSHPNCRCYSGHGERFAEGGEITSHYCAKGVPHKPGCEYATGGEVRKMYADPDEPVSQDDSAPQEPQTSKLQRDIAGLVSKHPWLAGPKGQGILGQLAKSEPQQTQPDQTPQGTQGPPNVSNTPPVGIAADNAIQPNTDQTPPDQPNSGQPPQVQPIQKMPGLPNTNMAMPQNAPTNQPGAPPMTGGMAAEPIMPPEVRNMPPAYQQAYTDAKNKHMQEWAQENAAFEHDLNNGHITPETYKSLMGKKDTLGKVATIFGMLIGGMGSGITGQPNAIMKMMDDQIQRDMTAQTQSKTNAQNFLRINQGAMTAKAQAQNLAVNTEATHQATAYARTAQTTFHNLVEEGKKITDPQKKAQYNTSLAMLYNKMGDKLVNMGDAQAGAQAFAEMMNNQNAPQSSDEGAKQNRWSQMQFMGPEFAQRAQWESNHSLPNTSGFTDREVESGDREKIKNHDILNNKVKEIVDMANKYNTGVWTNATQQGRDLLNTARQKASELESYYNTNLDGLGMTPGRLDWLHPQVTDDPTNWMNKLKGSTARLKEIGSSNLMRQNEIYKKYGKEMPNNGQSDTITVIRPDGKEGQIPRSNLQKAQKLGYKVK